MTAKDPVEAFAEAVVAAHDPGGAWPGPSMPRGTARRRALAATGKYRCTPSLGRAGRCCG